MRGLRAGGRALPPPWRRREGEDDVLRILISTDNHLVRGGRGEAEGRSAAARRRCSVACATGEPLGGPHTPAPPRTPPPPPPGRVGAR